MKRVVVVGGGAAGMLAAITASSNGALVTLLEQNEKLGKKIYITGKGRCNVSNACDTMDFFGSVVRNPKFLYSAIYSFDFEALRNLLEDSGCPIKIERGDRAFPVSDHASDVTNALYRRMKQLGVDIRLNTKLISITTDSVTGMVSGCVASSSGKQEKIDCDRLILATGGLSYPSTGSTGDGHRLLEGLGHTVTKCHPSLVPFICNDPVCKLLQGLSLKNVSLELLVGQKSIYKSQGEMLFTHEGISGPLVLSASSYYWEYLDKTKNKSELDERMDSAIARIDLKPALDFDSLDKRLIHDFSNNMNKQFKNSLDDLFPSKLIPVMIQRSGIDPQLAVNLVTKEARKHFAGLIKAFDLSITSTGSFREAVITKGGVCVKQIDPSTMESKQIHSLYVAGELLDVDALTGGFNLQIAFSTGYLAGLNAALED